MAHRLPILIFYCFSILFTLAAEEVLHEELFLSTPDQVASLLSEENYLIGGVISPLSGQPVLKHTDLIAQGAHNVILSRTYIPLYMPCFFPKRAKRRRIWQYFISD